MNSRMLILSGLVLWILLSVLCLLTHAKKIENKLTMHSQEILQRANMDGISVSFSGRNAGLSGTVISEAEIEKAENLVKAISGVRGVQSGLTIKTPVVEIPETKEISESKEKIESKEMVEAKINLAQLIADLRVEFETNNHRLNTQAIPVLNQVQSLLKEHSQSKIEIQGHADSRGSLVYNEKLSRRRAETVRSFLVKDGLSTERFSVVGFGETQPIADNSTPEGRRKNRRVEFIVKEED